MGESRHLYMHVYVMSVYYATTLTPGIHIRYLKERKRYKVSESTHKVGGQRRDELDEYPINIGGRTHLYLTKCGLKHRMRLNVRCKNLCVFPEIASECVGLPSPYLFYCLEEKSV